MEFLKKRSTQIVLAVLGVTIILCFVCWYYNSSGNKDKPPKVQLATSPSENKPTMVLFHSLACGHCTKFMPEWQKFANAHARDPRVKVMDVEASQPGAQELIAKHGLVGFPTVKFCPNGLEDVENSVEYKEGRTAESLEKFLNDQLSA